MSSVSSVGFGSWRTYSSYGHCAMSLIATWVTARSVDANVVVKPRAIVSWTICIVRTCSRDNVDG